jgi:vancomycin permeability regulator SanA
MMKVIEKINKKSLVIIAVAVLALVVLAVVYLLAVNAYVVGETKGNIILADACADLDGVDCIIVLGCKVKSDGSPSHMLEDRLITALEIYEVMAEREPEVKIIMSGDHGSEEYNEVYTMKQYAVAGGVDSEDVFMDHAGFSTYESIYRAKEIFGADKIVIVTQEYHLHRALHIANALGVEAYGVSASLRNYAGQIKFSAREILARNKDFITAIFKPEPTYLGEPISLAGSGDVTNDY